MKGEDELTVSDTAETVMRMKAKAGERICLLCHNNVYVGRLVDATDNYIQLAGAFLVYHAGEWLEKPTSLGDGVYVGVSEMIGYVVE